jgi:hypothetical protein
MGEGAMLLEVAPDLLLDFIVVSLPSTTEY